MVERDWMESKHWKCFQILNYWEVRYFFCLCNNTRNSGFQNPKFWLFCHSGNFSEKKVFMKMISIYYRNREYLLILGRDRELCSKVMESAVLGGEPCSRLSYFRETISLFPLQIVLLQIWKWKKNQCTMGKNSGEENSVCKWWGQEIETRQELSKEAWKQQLQSLGSPARKGRGSSDSYHLLNQRPCL